MARLQVRPRVKTLFTEPSSKWKLEIPARSPASAGPKVLCAQLWLSSVVSVDMKNLCVWIKPMSIKISCFIDVSFENLKNFE